MTKCRDMGTWDIRFCSVKKRYNSVYTLTALHWRGGEAPNVTLIPFKWHLWSRDIILIYPLNPPFAALFAAITHTFFIICILFCVNYVDLRSSQGNFSLWKWNEVQIIQDWTRESSSSSPAVQRPSAARVATLMAPGGSELAACSNNAQQLFIKNYDEFYICTIIYLLLIYYLFVCDIDMEQHW